MSKKFSGFPNQGPSVGPELVCAPDEKVLVVHFSTTAGYINMHEEHGKQIDALEGLSVLLNIALQFVGVLADQKRMLVGQGGNSGSEKKENDTGP